MDDWVVSNTLEYRIRVLLRVYSIVVYGREGGRETLVLSGDPLPLASAHRHHTRTHARTKDGGAGIET